MLESHLLTKLYSIELTFQELTTKLEGPSILSPSELKQIFKDIAAIEETVTTFHLWQKASSDLIPLQQIIRESTTDRELQKLATLERGELDRQITNLEYRLRRLLLPKDPHDEKNVIIEITTGIGGDEAGIWVRDLMRMYERYAEAWQWQSQILTEQYSSSDLPTSLILEIKGACLHGKLKFESGIHELQRYSVLASKKKIIISTATVTVMPEVDEGDFNVAAQDLEFCHYQYRGIPRRPESEVILRHKPTEMRIHCNKKRHQRQNKELVIQILRAKLYSIELQRQQEYLTRLHPERNYLDPELLPLMTNDIRKIRSYNYSDNRVIDRRLAQHFELDKVIGGELDEIIQSCLDRDIQERISLLVDS